MYYIKICKRQRDLGNNNGTNKLFSKINNPLHTTSHFSGAKGGWASLKLPMPLPLPIPRARAR